MQCQPRESAPNLHKAYRTDERGDYGGMGSMPGALKGKVDVPGSLCKGVGLASMVLSTWLMF